MELQSIGVGRTEHVEPKKPVIGLPPPSIPFQDSWRRPVNSSIYNSIRFEMDAHGIHIQYKDQA
nr:hypothetical protein [Delftia acidovorans]